MLGNNVARDARHRHADVAARSWPGRLRLVRIAACVIAAVPVMQAASGAPALQSTAVEPAVSSKVYDAVNGQPVAGAVVFGFYAAARGSLAGGYTTGSALHRFSVATGPAGEFALDAWTGPAVPVAQRREQFPVVAIFKPGYRTQLAGLNSIAQWGSLPMHQLQPAGSAIERYIGLRAAGRAMELSAPCAWQTYAPALQAMHDELKDLIRQTVRPEDLDGAGYLRSGRPHPLANVDFLTRSTVDRLIESYRESPATWACANPEKLLKGSRR